MSKTKTNDQFLLELKTINPRIVPEEPYINNHTKILCHCKACGNSWYARPNSLLRGYGCPYCAGNFKKNNSDFVKELAQINPDIEPLEKYNGNKGTILCRCKICGNEWKVSPNNLLSKGHKCPRCSRQKRGIDRRKSNEEFAKALSLINPNITPLEPYITSQHKIKCKCNICGYVWSTTPNNLLDKGSRCPNCSHASTSIVEQILIANEEFVSRLSIINEDVIPLEPYVRGDISIRCKCRRCSNEWSTKAHNLLSGRGCPKCVRAHTTALQSKPIRCVETGICYDSIADVYRKTGISNVHKCAKGYQKTAGGFHWEYIDE